ncbi:MAG: methyltransferase domain-containing protein [Elusimicrobia bacterium]|nr:methyltransferase domain-containing protein [Elusimicrobiota bacterium]
MNPILWLTRELRVRIVLPFIPNRDVHVDIGCGPAKYLLGKSPCLKKIGFDAQLGSELEERIFLDTNSVDCITMLAVIEHLTHSLQIIQECHRILKDDGVLIITTPKAKGFWLMNLYAPGFEKKEGPHVKHFEYDEMIDLLKGYFTVSIYKTFAFGYNQLFVCRKCVHCL